VDPTSADGEDAGVGVVITEAIELFAEAEVTERLEAEEQFAVLGGHRATFFDERILVDLELTQGVGTLAVVEQFSGVGGTDGAEFFGSFGLIEIGLEYGGALIVEEPIVHRVDLSQGFIEDLGHLDGAGPRRGWLGIGGLTTGDKESQATGP